MTRLCLRMRGIAALIAASIVASAGSVQAQETIKVGWLGPLSGVLAAYGLENKRGVEYAVEKINAAGGINGRKLEVIYVDSKFDPAFAVQSIQRFALQDKVVAILGDISSAVTVAMVPATARMSVPQLASLAGTPKITALGSKYIFRPYPAVTLTYPTMARYAVEKLGAKRFATLAYNDEGGLASIEAFTKAVKDSGKGQVVAAEVVPVDTKEFKGILTKLRRENPDALVLAAAASVSGLISKQVRELGWNVQLLGHGGYHAVAEYREIAGPAGDGMILVTTYAPGYYKHPEAVKFVDEWKAKYGDLPRDLEAHGNDQVNLLATAIRTVGDNRNAIRDALAKVKDWPGAAGLYTFRENGDVYKELVVQTWKDGKLVPIEVFAPPK